MTIVGTIQQVFPLAEGRREEGANGNRQAGTWLHFEGIHTHKWVNTICQCCLGCRKNRKNQSLVDWTLLNLIWLPLALLEQYLLQQLVTKTILSTN